MQIDVKLFIDWPKRKLVNNKDIQEENTVNGDLNK